MICLSGTMAATRWSAASGDGIVAHCVGGTAAERKGRWGWWGRGGRGGRWPGGPTNISVRSTPREAAADTHSGSRSASAAVAAIATSPVATSITTGTRV